MYERNQSFNFLSVQQKIAQGLATRCVPLGGFVVMAELGATQLLQIENFNYFHGFALF